MIAANATKGPFYSFTFHTPAFGSSTYRQHCYADTSFTWHPQKQKNIDSGMAPGFPSNTAKSDGSTLMFSRGGIQGGEGVTGGEAWYIENVLEELVRHRMAINTSHIMFIHISCSPGEFMSIHESILMNSGVSIRVELFPGRGSSFKTGTRYRYESADSGHYQHFHCSIAADHTAWSRDQDMGREWYFDELDQILIYKPNTTTTGAAAAV